MRRTSGQVIISTDEYNKLRDFKENMRPNVIMLETYSCGANHQISFIKGNKALDEAAKIVQICTETIKEGQELLSKSQLEAEVQKWYIPLVYTLVGIVIGVGACLIKYYL